MHVKDGPVEYANFEGTIPPGNYGAGIVMVWDQGTYEHLTGNPASAFHQGEDAPDHEREEAEGGVDPGQKLQR